MDVNDKEMFTKNIYFYIKSIVNLLYNMLFLEIF